MDLDKKRKVIFLDSLECEDRVKLSLVNRIRLLFGGELCVLLKLDTQKPVGQFRFDNGILVEPIFPDRVRYHARRLRPSWGWLGGKRRLLWGRFSSAKQLSNAEDT